MTANQIQSFLYETFLPVFGRIGSVGERWLSVGATNTEERWMDLVGGAVILGMLALMVIKPRSWSQPGAGNGIGRGGIAGRGFPFVLDATFLPTRDDFLDQYSLILRWCAILMGVVQVGFLSAYLLAPELQAATMAGLACDIVSVAGAFSYWRISTTRASGPTASGTAAAACLAIAVVVVPPSLVNQLGLSQATASSDRFVDAFGFMVAATTAVGLALGALLQARRHAGALRAASAPLLLMAALLALSTVALRHDPFHDILHIYSDRTLEEGWSGVFCISNFAAAFAVLDGFLRLAANRMGRMATPHQPRGLTQ